LTLEQKTTIVDQALLMFEKLYPHRSLRNRRFFLATRWRRCGRSGRICPPCRRENFTRR
jgi:hypothetical protein